MELLDTIEEFEKDLLGAKDFILCNMLNIDTNTLNRLMEPIDSDLATECLDKKEMDLKTLIDNLYSVKETEFSPVRLLHLSILTLMRDCIVEEALTLTKNKQVIDRLNEIKKVDIIGKNTIFVDDMFDYVLDYTSTIELNAIILIEKLIRNKVEEVKIKDFTFDILETKLKGVTVPVSISLYNLLLSLGDTTHRNTTIIDTILRNSKLKKKEFNLLIACKELLNTEKVDYIDFIVNKDSM